MHSWQCPGDIGLDSFTRWSHGNPSRPSAKTCSASSVQQTSQWVSESQPAAFKLLATLLIYLYSLRGADYRDDSQLPYQDPWGIP